MASAGKKREAESTLPLPHTAFWQLFSLNFYLWQEEKRSYLEIAAEIDSRLTSRLQMYPKKEKYNKLGEMN